MLNQFWSFGSRLQGLTLSQARSISWDTVLAQMELWERLGNTCLVRGQHLGNFDYSGLWMKCWWWCSVSSCLLEVWFEQIPSLNKLQKPLPVQDADQSSCPDMLIAHHKKIRSQSTKEMEGNESIGGLHFAPRRCRVYVQIRDIFGVSRAWTPSNALVVLASIYG